MYMYIIIIIIAKKIQLNKCFIISIIDTIRWMNYNYVLIVNE